MFKVFLGSTFKDLHEHRAALEWSDAAPALVISTTKRPAGQSVCELAPGW